MSDAWICAEPEDVAAAVNLYNSTFDPFAPAGITRMLVVVLDHETVIALPPVAEVGRLILTGPEPAPLLLRTIPA